MAPLLIGFILGTMLEDNFAPRDAALPGVRVHPRRPMTLGLLVLAGAAPSSAWAPDQSRAAKRAEGVAEMRLTTTVYRRGDPFHRGPRGWT